MKTLKTDYPDTGPGRTFRMPGEFEPHHGCLMIWPWRPGSWNYGAEKAKVVFADLILQIAESDETVYVFARPEDQKEAEQMLPSDNVRIFAVDNDDAWARDTGPTFVLTEEGERAGISWQFNAWGGSYDGLYQSWDKDQQIAGTLCEILEDPCIDAGEFVLEGGSIHSDGQGTILTTEECLLSPGRNPNLSREEIEGKLKQYLGAEKIIWLPEGIYNDETNGHVDNICAFTAPGEVVLAWTDDPSDPQYDRSRRALEVLETETDARGRRFTVRKLPIPEEPICITEEDLMGYEFEEGEDQREVGERLAASYVNFYIANDSILVPQFGDSNDLTALDILAECFPDRSIIPISARVILTGGGNIHCITQQIPAAATEQKGI